MNRPAIKPSTNSSIKAWVNSALSNELLYGEGEPRWTHSVNKSVAEQERVKLIRFLAKHASTKPDLNNIAEKLIYCSPGHRCYCAVCPECGRAFQRFFVSECQTLFIKGSLCVASIIDSKQSIRQELSRFSASGLINRTKSIFCKNGVDFAAGGIDFSFNEDEIGTVGSHWCAHLWVILPDRNRCRWEPALRLANPASEAVLRPIKINTYDGRNEALAYALKTTFKRRISVHQERRIGNIQQRNTSEQDLRVAERIPLYTYLDSIGLHARVFLLGARPTMTERGFSFVKLKAKSVKTPKGGRKH
jgi:hypothetical protein